MIFGRSLAGAALALTVCAAPAWAEPDTVNSNWTLPALMARLAQTQSETATFVERRTLQVVITPLQSSGTLRYIAPDRLEKQTLLPHFARLSVAAGLVTIEREGETTQTITLADYPEIGALVEGLRATMAGDLPALQRYYTVRLEGNAGAWSIILRPRDARMQKLVHEIKVTGNGGVLAQIDTIETDGDHSEMTITPAGK